MQWRLDKRRMMMDIKMKFKLKLKSDDIFWRFDNKI